MNDKSSIFFQKGSSILREIERFFVILQPFYINRYSTHSIKHKPHLEKWER